MQQLGVHELRNALDKEYEQIQILARAKNELLYWGVDPAKLYRWFESNGSTKPVFS